MYMQTSTYQQEDHYYPYGGLMGESSGGDIQPYKYNGKELNRMHGLDWYDNGARHYDAAIVSWPTMDPLCEKYYNLSPYNYCGNNPINSIDREGTDITFMIATNGAKGHEHMGAIIGNKFGFYYITAGAIGGGYSMLSNSSQEGVINIIPVEASSMEMAITIVRNSDKINSYYDGTITFITSTKMDDNMLDVAYDKQNKFATGEETYRLFTNNCADIVKDIFEKGTDVDLQMGISPRPNDNFDNICDNKDDIQVNLYNKMINEKK